MDIHRQDLYIEENVTMLQQVPTASTYLNSLPGEEALALEQYLSNPLIVEISYEHAGLAGKEDLVVRYALNVRDGQHSIRLKSVDVDSKVFYSAEEVQKGRFNVNSEHYYTIKPIGRYSDLLETSNPPQKTTEEIFSNELVELRKAIGAVEG